MALGGATLEDNRCLAHGDHFSAYTPECLGCVACAPGEALRTLNNSYHGCCANLILAINKLLFKLHEVLSSFFANGTVFCPAVKSLDDCACRKT